MSSISTMFNKKIVESATVTTSPEQILQDSSSIDLVGPSYALLISFFFVLVIYIITTKGTFDLNKV